MLRQVSHLTGLPAEPRGPLTFSSVTRPHDDHNAAPFVWIRGIFPLRLGKGRRRRIGSCSFVCPPSLVGVGVGGRHTKAMTL